MLKPEGTETDVGGMQARSSKRLAVHTISMGTPKRRSMAYQ
jgi:hypothetical protein